MANSPSYNGQLDTIETILPEALDKIREAQTLSDWDALRVHYLGKKGLLTALLKQLGELPVAERPIVGNTLNAVKERIQSALQQRQQQLCADKVAQRLAQASPDIGLPGRGQCVGALNPISLCRRRIEDFFTKFGFDIIEGPEIENDFYNFSALNIPERHPARAMHDTFYLNNQLLLRTHTSPVQIHTLETRQPPLRMIAPGRVFRCDSDATHSPMFHQVEALVVDRQTSFADLKGIVQSFLDYFFDDDHLKIRFRPSYFPFTEPSAEVDVCNKNGEWLEVMGCGMLHPNVFKLIDYPIGKWRGYAFGMGIERLAMLRYGVDDLRLFFNNDIHFLEQFGG